MTVTEERRRCLMCGAEWPLEQCVAGHCPACQRSGPFVDMADDVTIRIGKNELQRIVEWAAQHIATFRDSDGHMTEGAYGHMANVLDGIVTRINEQAPETLKRPDYTPA